MSDTLYQFHDKTVSPKLWTIFNWRFLTICLLISTASRPPDASFAHGALLITLRVSLRWTQTNPKNLETNVLPKDLSWCWSFKKKSRFAQFSYFSPYFSVSDIDSYTGVWIHLFFYLYIVVLALIVTKWFCQRLFSHQEVSWIFPNEREWFLNGKNWQNLPPIVHTSILCSLFTITTLTIISTPSSAIDGSFYIYSIVDHISRL